MSGALESGLTQFRSYGDEVSTAGIGLAPGRVQELPDVVAFGPGPSLLGKLCLLCVSVNRGSRLGNFWKPEHMSSFRRDDVGVGTAVFPCY